MSERVVLEDIARVEGHGGIDVVMDNGKVTRVNLDIFEGARFFERLLVGRHFTEVPAIVSRVCAICSAGHTITSQLAIESALGIKVSRQTELLRELLFLGQMIESHSLHLYCLSVPDYLGYSGAISLAKDHPDEVRFGLGLKKLGNRIQETVGGRAIHPVNAIVGGFGKVPGRDALLSLRDALLAALSETDRVIHLLGDLNVPQLGATDTQFAALEPASDDFGFFGQVVSTSWGQRFDAADYRALTNEHVVGHSHAKHSESAAGPYAVGSLARLSLHGSRMRGYGLRAMEALGLASASPNMLLNNHAQAIELIYSLERAAAIADELATAGLVDEKPVPLGLGGQGGEGTAATEVPRGTLYHSYAFDAAGRMSKADIITPTAQNLANVEKDIRSCAEKCHEYSQTELLANLELIVRAYDPCISCSVHVVDLA